MVAVRVMVAVVTIELVGVTMELGLGVEAVPLMEVSVVEPVGVRVGMHEDAVESSSQSPVIVVVPEGLGVVVAVPDGPGVVREVGPVGEIGRAHV